MGGAPNTAAYTQLATKLESLINTCLQPNVLPDIAKRVGSSTDMNHLQRLPVYAPDIMCNLHSLL